MKNVSKLLLISCAVEIQQKPCNFYIGISHYHIRSYLLWMLFGISFPFMTNKQRFAERSLRIVMRGSSYIKKIVHRLSKNDLLLPLLSVLLQEPWNFYLCSIALLEWIKQLGKQGSVKHF